MLLNITNNLIIQQILFLSTPFNLQSHPPLQYLVQTNMGGAIPFIPIIPHALNTVGQIFQGMKTTVEKQYIHQADPKLAQQIAELRKMIQEINDPKKMAENVRKLKVLYWEQLKSQEFPLFEGKSVIFIGRTSVGKTSLLNTIFKTEEAVSKASCTKEIKIIAKIKNITIFDCPGIDEHFDIVKFPEKIPQYLGPMEHIYYLYDGYIEEDIVKTFMAMRKKFYAVRTKVDPDDNPSENESVREKDMAALQHFGCPTKVFLTSKKGGVDNEALLQHILG